jgi:hypothetical protein
MDRRDFIKNSSLILLAGMASPTYALRAFGEEKNPPADLLNGVIPDGASPAVSTLFKFPHHHYVYIPREILEKPPEAGFATTTSMIVPALGVDQRLINQKRQFHYHMIKFTHAQLKSIAQKAPTRVDLLLDGALNHQFMFNGAKSFEEITREMHAEAVEAKRPIQLKGPIVPLRVG